MTRFIIRCALFLASLGFTVYLFADGSWGWGIMMILATAVIGLTFLRHENMIMALNQMRVGNTDKAQKHINKITHPQLLPKKQHAYILFLQAVLNTQEFGFAKTEAMLRKAITIGLRTDQDSAVSRMHLAGICAQTGRKAEAITLLKEAKKLDTKGMMKDQINTMSKQLQMAPSKNQMRMAQMMGGRKKSPRSK
ncbi:MAG: hypothetical protein ACI9XP_001837 [Lentimonas sp.]|jgi:hypothetical protein